MDFVYNGASEITNRINVPEGFDWDVFGYLHNAAESEGAEFVEN